MGWAYCPSRENYTGCYEEGSCLTYTYMLMDLDKVTYVLFNQLQTVPQGK